MTAALQKDAYKIGHVFQYKKGTEYVYSNFTPRSGKHSNILGSKGVFFVGLQYFIQNYLIDEWNNTFFNVEKAKAVGKYQKYVSKCLGYQVPVEHIEKLHDLGYLPLRIKALPEGSFVPYGIPPLTIINTHPDMGFLTNMIESVLSCELWLPITTATTYMAYRKNSLIFSEKTCDDNSFVPWQNHDFSFRGMQGRHAAALSGFASLACGSYGTDTLPAIELAVDYYGADLDSEIIGMSVAATEHSVMTTGNDGDEFETIENLITNIYPTGMISIVSDSYDFWRVVTEHLLTLKDKIINRDGKLIIRPDCYSDDTEIFTNSGWKLFKDLTEHDLVAQVDENNEFYSFVRPDKIVNFDYSGDMYHFKDHFGKMDLIVTPEHRMVSSINSKTKIDFAKDIKLGNSNKKFHRSAKAINQNKSLSFIERLNIAFQADGSYCSGVKSSIRFSFSKQRKINRLETLLKENNIEFKKYNLNDGKTEFNIKIDSDLVSKNFDWVDLDDLCSNWCQEFIDELSYWDATIRNDNKIKFDTTNTNIINVVENIAFSAGFGYYTSKRDDSRKDIFNDVYTIHIMKDNKISSSAINKEVIQYNGKVYCVKVPTGKILVRRNKCTMICGNSGDPVDIICGTNQDLLVIDTTSKLREIICNVDKDIDFYYTPTNEYYHVSVDNIELFVKYSGNDALLDNASNIDYLKEMSLIVNTKIEPEEKGLIMCLWEIFGGHINTKNYKVLIPQIGAIYGDSITLERQFQILMRLENRGFASSNIVFGVGSYTYAFVTRDTHGMAFKTTWAQINGNGYAVFKDPKTDQGANSSSKKSARGLLMITNGIKGYELVENVSFEQEKSGALQTVFLDGELKKFQHLHEIREQAEKNMRFI